MSLRGLLIALEFLCALAIAHSFEAAGYGVYALARSWIELLAIPAAVGFDRLVVREMAIYRAREAWGLARGLLKSSRAIVLLASTALASLFAIVAPTVMPDATRGNMRALQMAMLAVPIIAFGRLRQAALQGLGRVVLAQVPETLVQPLLLLTLVGVLHMIIGTSTHAGSLATAAYVASTAAASLAGVLILRRAVPITIRNAPAEHRIREWLASAAPFLWMLGMNVIMTNADTIFVGLSAGATQAGVYRLASQMAMLVAFPLTCMNMAVAPRIAGLYASGDMAALQAAARDAVRAVFLVTLPILAILCLGGRELLGLFGPEFATAYPALLLLCAGQIVNVAMGISGYLLIMTRHARLVAAVFAGGAAVSVVGNLLLIPLWGIQGAAAATALALSLLSVTFGVLVWRKLAIQATVFSMRTPQENAA